MAEPDVATISTEELNEVCRISFCTMRTTLAKMMQKGTRNAQLLTAMKEERVQLKAEIQRLKAEIQKQKARFEGLEIADKGSRFVAETKAKAAAAEIERLKEMVVKLEEESERAIAESRKAKKETRAAENALLASQKKNESLEEDVKKLKRRLAKAEADAVSVRADAVAALGSASTKENYLVPRPARVEAIRSILRKLSQTPGFDATHPVLVFQITKPGSTKKKPEHFIAIATSGGGSVLSVADKEFHNGLGPAYDKNKRIFDPEGHIPSEFMDGLWSKESFTTRNASYEWLKTLGLARKYGAPSSDYGILFGGKWYSCHGLCKQRARFRLEHGGEEAGDAEMKKWLEAGYSELWAGLGGPAAGPAAGPAPAAEVAVQLPGGLKRPAPEPEPEPEQAASDAEVVVVVDDDGAASEPPEKRARSSDEAVESVDTADEAVDTADEPSVDTADEPSDGSVDRDSVDGIEFTSADSMDALGLGEESARPDADPDPDPNPVALPRVREVAGQHRDGPRPSLPSQGRRGLSLPSQGRRGLSLPGRRLK